jgi:hypothetical protein
MSLVRHGARKRVPPATRRRALELLASCRDGCPEAIMLAHGFSIIELANSRGFANSRRSVPRRSVSDGPWPFVSQRTPVLA